MRLRVCRQRGTITSRKGRRQPEWAKYRKKERNRDCNADVSIYLSIDLKCIYITYIQTHPLLCAHSKKKQPLSLLAKCLCVPVYFLDVVATRSNQSRNDSSKSSLIFCSHFLSRHTKDKMIWIDKPEFVVANIISSSLINCMPKTLRRVGLKEH